ncbi:hypothetical protein CR513_50987, partial [Mucuna pruriens]
MYPNILLIHIYPEEIQITGGFLERLLRARVQLLKENGSGSVGDKSRRSIFRSSITNFCGNFQQATKLEAIEEASSSGHEELEEFMSFNKSYGKRKLAMFGSMTKFKITPYGKIRDTNHNKVISVGLVACHANSCTIELEVDELVMGNSSSLLPISTIPNCQRLKANSVDFYIANLF